MLVHRLEQELSRTMDPRCSSARLEKEVNDDDVEVPKWMPRVSNCTGPRIVAFSQELICSLLRACTRVKRTLQNIRSGALTLLRFRSSSSINHVRVCSWAC